MPNITARTRIAKQFTFDSAHFLPTVPVDHKCRRMHGHTYVVELIFEGMTVNGFCAGIDYADIAAVWQPIHDQIDHRTLNEIAGLEVPSTEILVWWIADRFVEEALKTDRRELAMALVKVRVQESSTTWCETSTPLSTADILAGIPEGRSSHG